MCKPPYVNQHYSCHILSVCDRFPKIIENRISWKALFQADGQTWLNQQSLFAILRRCLKERKTVQTLLNFCLVGTFSFHATQATALLPVFLLRSVRMQHCYRFCFGRRHFRCFLHYSLVFCYYFQIYVLRFLRKIFTVWSYVVVETAFYVCWTVHHCDNWRIKNQLDATCYFIVLLIGSICFGHYYAHHQKLATTLLNYHIGWFRSWFVVCWS